MVATTDRQLYNVAIHEAGHAIAAVARGIPVYELTVTSGDGLVGGCVHHAGRRGERVAALLEVIAAGPVAQLQECGRCPGWAEGTSHDRRTFRKALEALPVALRETAGLRAEQQARKLAHVHHDTIDRIAGALVRRRVLGPSALRDLLPVSLATRPTSPTLPTGERALWTGALRAAGVAVSLDARYGVHVHEVAIDEGGSGRVVHDAEPDVAAEAERRGATAAALLMDPDVWRSATYRLSIPEMVAEYESKGWVQEHRGAILAVAAALRERGSLSGNRVGGIAMRAGGRAVAPHQVTTC